MKTRKELFARFAELEAGILNSRILQASGNRAYESCKHTQWELTNKECQVLARICMMDNVDRKIIDNCILNTAVHLNDGLM